MTNVKDTADRAIEYASETLQVAADQVRDGTGAALGAASEAYEAAREKAAAALASAKESAGDFRRKSAEGIDTNPFAVLAGGIALGVVLGALIPRSEREAQALAPIGGKLADAAKSAIAAAGQAGLDTLDELGINSANAKGSVEKLVGTVTKAATSAGSAAVDAVRNNG